MSSALESTTCNSQCFTCLDKPSTLKRASVNGCTHIFCSTCVDKWSKEDKSCPLWRKHFDQIRYLPHESKLHNESTDLSSLDDGTFTKLEEQFYDEKNGNLTVRDLNSIVLNDLLDKFSHGKVSRIKLRSWIMVYNLRD